MNLWRNWWTGVPEAAPEGTRLHLLPTGADKGVAAVQPAASNSPLDCCISLSKKLSYAGLFLFYVV